MREQFLAAIRENPEEVVNHYAYADWLEDNGFDDEARVQREWSLKKYLDAVAYISSYAFHCDINLQDMLNEANAHLDDPGHFFTCWGFDDPKIHNEDMGVFWRHFEVLTGRPVNIQELIDNYDAVFVTCSC